jgi:hypothetical protein
MKHLIHAVVAVMICSIPCFSYDSTSDELARLNYQMRQYRYEQQNRADWDSINRANEDAINRDRAEINRIRQEMERDRERNR